MTDCNRLKCQDIPFLIDGVAKIVKSVNKQTTCNDVINKLPNLQCPLAVFESVNGMEKELPGKVKLLKAWRSHGPSDRVVFVVKKSNYVLKGSRSGPLKENKVHMSTARRKARASLKKVTDLAFYVRYQKTKLQNVKRKLDEVDTSNEDTTKNVMHYSTSFRDQQIHIPEYEIREDVKHVYNNSIQTGMTTLKLGFKQKFASNSKVAKRTTSAGTISSSDSGYTSVTSEGQGNHVKSLTAELAKRPMVLDSNIGDVPRHSTPMIARSHGKVECDTEENDPFDLSFYDEIEGKDSILKKFMADQERMAKEIDSRASIGCYGVLPEIEDHVISSRFSLPTFRSQKEKCRYLWDANCDSDSDTSSVADDSVLWNASKLDNAFVDSYEDTTNSDCVTLRNRTLRRESAMSNLKKFSLQLMPIDIEDEYDSFNYSFDCTFPRMDESQSVEYSECFGEDFSNGNDNFGINLFGGDSEDIVTRDLRKDMCDDSVVESDEGLGSMQSGSVQGIIEFYV